MTNANWASGNFTLKRNSGLEKILTLLSGQTKRSYVTLRQQKFKLIVIFNNFQFYTNENDLFPQLSKDISHDIQN